MKEQKRVIVLCVTILILMAGMFVGPGKQITEAKTFPERDILFISPYGVGGGGDLVSRATAEYLKKHLPKQVNVIIQSIGDAGGRIGAFKVYDAKPDGYTIGTVNPEILIEAAAMGEIGKRDLMRLTWMQRVTSQKYLMAVSSKSSIKTVQDLKGRKLTASVSKSSLITTAVFLRSLGAEPQVVMYGGGADSCMAAMRGDVDLVIQSAGTVVRTVKASEGKLIPLAALTEERISGLPDVPTAKEAGIPIPAELDPVMSLDLMYIAPYGLSEEVYRIYINALEKTIRDPEFVDKLKRINITIDYLSPEDVQKRISVLLKAFPKFKKDVEKSMGK